jgi:hypothetical protein
MSRNTRYVLVAILFLIGIVYVLFPGSRPVAVKYHHWRLHDSDLPRRMEVSHRIYDNQLRDHQKLIKKFGPHAKDIVKCVSLITGDIFLIFFFVCLVSFPPDKAPWPPYTVCPFRSFEFRGQWLTQFIYNRGLFPRCVQLPS